MSREGFDIALFIDGSTTLSQFHDIVDRLDDLDIWADYASLEFESNGLYFTAKHSAEDISSLEGELAKIGVQLDWDAMSDWVDEVSE